MTPSQLSSEVDKRTELRAKDNAARSYSQMFLCTGLMVAIAIPAAKTLSVAATIQSTACALHKITNIRQVGDMSQGECVRGRTQWKRGHVLVCRCRDNGATPASGGERRRVGLKGVRAGRGVFNIFFLGGKLLQQQPTRQSKNDSSILVRGKSSALVCVRAALRPPRRKERCCVALCPAVDV